MSPHPANHPANLFIKDNMILEFASRWFVAGLQIKTSLYLGKREVHLSKSSFLSSPPSSAPNTGTLGF